MLSRLKLSLKCIRYNYVYWIYFINKLYNLDIDPSYHLFPFYSCKFSRPPNIGFLYLKMALSYIYAQHEYTGGKLLIWYLLFIFVVLISTFILYRILVHNLSSISQNVNCGRFFLHDIKFYYKREIYHYHQ